MPFLFRSYQGKSQWANQDLLIPSSLPIIDFTTFNSATNVANTGTSVLFGGSALTMSNYDYITTSPQKFTSVAVNSQQTRMIIATYYGAWYSTSTDAGANWTIPTQIPGTPTPVTPFAENGDQSVSCAMSADGTKASINGKMKNNNVFYSIYWGYSNSSPTATLITITIPSITYPSATMAFNGNVVLLGGMSSSNLQYAVWNSSTNQYGSLQNLKYSDGVTNVVQIDMFYM